MLVLRLQLLEELGDVHAGPVREVLGFVLIFSVVTSRVAHDEVSKSFEVAALELHGAIIASEADRLPDSATLVSRSSCTGRSGVQHEGTSEQVSRVRPDGHPMHVEPLTERDHALAVRACSSDSFHLLLGQGCSSSSPRVRDDFRLVLGGTFRVVANTEFRLLPRGTKPLEPLPGVRFESTRVHKNGNET